MLLSAKSTATGTVSTGRPKSLSNNMCVYWTDSFSICTICIDLYTVFLLYLLVYVKVRIYGEKIYLFARNIVHPLRYKQAYTRVHYKDSFAITRAVTVDEIKLTCSLCYYWKKCATTDMACLIIRQDIPPADSLDITRYSRIVLQYPLRLNTIPRFLDRSSHDRINLISKPNQHHEISEETKTTDQATETTCNSPQGCQT